MNFLTDFEMDISACSTGQNKYQVLTLILLKWIAYYFKTTECEYFSAGSAEEWNQRETATLK